MPFLVAELKAGDVKVGRGPLTQLRHGQLVVVLAARIVRVNERFGMTPINVTHEARVDDAVTQEFLDTLAVLARGSGGNGEHHIFDLPQTWAAILRSDGKAHSVGCVGAAAMYERAGEEQDRSGGHSDLEYFVTPGLSILRPMVAAGNDFGCAIVIGEIIKSPDGAVAIGLAWSW